MWSYSVWRWNTQCADSSRTSIRLSWVWTWLRLLLQEFVDVFQLNYMPFCTFKIKNCYTTAWPLLKHPKLILCVQLSSRDLFVRAILSTFKAVDLGNKTPIPVDISMWSVGVMIVMVFHFHFLQIWKCSNLVTWQFLQFTGAVFKQNLTMPVFALVSAFC